MSTKDADFGDLETDPGDFGVRGRNSETAARSGRLRQAVREAGGNKAISARAGIPIASLNNYLSGRDMKAQPLVDLANATGVRVEWLATGAGPMRPGAEPAPATPPPPAVSGNPRPLFAAVDIDRLGRALEQAGPLLQAHQGRIPDARRFAQILLLLYDDLAAAEKSSSPPET